MKRLMLTIFISAGVVGIASAQTTGSNSSANTMDVSSPGSANVNSNGHSLSLKYPNMNQRLIYHWKSGQRATPTGEQATSVNGGYASLEPNTTTAIDDKSSSTNADTTTQNEGGQQNNQ